MQVKDTSRKFNLKGGEMAVFEASDENVSGTDEYYGYLNADGAWIIQYIDRSTQPVPYRFVAGTSDYSTAWGNRASLEYGYYNAIFPTIQ